MEKTILVTGGLGYLGSHICKYLHRDGYKVVVYDRSDNLSHEYFDYFYSHDIRDEFNLVQAFSQNKIDAVIHLAGRIEVGESMKHPIEFWNNNVAGTSTLLSVMSAFNVKNIVFSSTAAVYDPTDYPIREERRFANNSVYGNTKISCERMIQDSKMNYGIFRYFNLAGCDPEIDIGENHEPETHLIPNIFKNINNFVINGNEYLTDDGTCVRDYVHVSDVAHAHIKALDMIMKDKSFILNLGTGKGHSILEIIDIVQETVGRKVNYTFGPKREGDPDYLVANVDRARELLGYLPQHDIRSIVETAYKWYEKLNREKV